MASLCGRVTLPGELEADTHRSLGRNHDRALVPTPSGLRQTGEGLDTRRQLLYQLSLVKGRSDCQAKGLEQETPREGGQEDRRQLRDPRATRENRELCGYPWVPLTVKKRQDMALRGAQSQCSKLHPQ